jgi:hypothetical protein
MLNDARISAGKPALGFLNPWLYETGYAGLNDITLGNNPGCGTEGFNSTIGWDPGTSYRFFFFLVSCNLGASLFLDPGGIYLQAISEF